MVSCSSHEYEDCPKDRIIGEWGVTNSTHTFGEYDSLYYLINPIGNVKDTVYYNGNYTDSYYLSDPVRVMLRYTLQDSLEFSLDRLYVTQTNPRHLVMMVQQKDDSLRRECVLYLEKAENNDRLFYGKADSLFKDMLREGKPLAIEATNGGSTSEPQGSQNYEFTFYPDGFEQALQLAKKLNPTPKEKSDSTSIPKDSTKHHHW